MAKPAFPIPSFYFKVSFDGAVGSESNLSCQKISGIGMSLTTKETKPGGRSAHTIESPDRSKYDHVTIKKGVNFASDAWSTLRANFFSLQEYDKVLQMQDKIMLDQLRITVMSEKGKEHITWALINAWPIKWVMDEFDSMKSGIMTESVTFVYNNMNYQ